MAAGSPIFSLEIQRYRRRSRDSNNHRSTPSFPFLPNLFRATPHFYSDSVVAGNNERLNDIEYVSRMRRCNYASPVHVHLEMRTAADVVDDCERRSRVARKYFYSSATFRRKHAIEERSVFETRNRWFSIRPTARNDLVVRRKKRMGSRSKRITLIAGKNTNDRPVNSICLLLLSSSVYFQRSK